MGRRSCQRGIPVIVILGTALLCPLHEGRSTDPPQFDVQDLIKVLPPPPPITRIEGTVRDAFTGDPIPVAVIVPGWDGDTLIVGVDGCYVIGDIPADTVTFLVTAVDYQPVIVGFGDLRNSSQVQQDVLLTPWPWTSGRFPPADYTVVGSFLPAGKGIAYREGWQAAQVELAAGTATHYTYGLRLYPAPVIDEESGLPIQAVSGCVVTTRLLEYIHGHNAAVAQWVDLHGIPAWSRRPWVDELRFPSEYFEKRALAEPAIRLAEDCGDEVSPDGRWSIRVEPIEGFINPVGRILVRESPNSGGREARLLLFDSSVNEFFWGPAGADVAVFRTCWDFRFLPEDPIETHCTHHILDLRTGAWLNETGIGRAGLTSDQQ